MKNMKRTLWSLVAVLAIAVGLLAMLGMFWVLEIAPLILFVGMAVAYGLLSSPRTPKTKVVRENLHDQQRSGGA